MICDCCNRALCPTLDLGATFPRTGDIVGALSAILECRRLTTKRAKDAERLIDEILKRRENDKGGDHEP